MIQKSGPEPENIEPETSPVSPQATLGPQAQKPLKINELHEKTSMAADLLIDASDAGWFVTNFIMKLHKALSPAGSTVQTGSIYADLVLSGLNFIRYPLLWLTSKILGEKNPLTLTRTAEMVYAGFLLGIAIASFVVPGALPTLLLISSIATAVVSLLMLGKALHDANEINNHKLPAIEKEINSLTEKQNSLRKALEENPTEQDRIAYTGSIQAIDTQLQELKDKKQHYKEKLSGLHVSELRDKAVGAVVASIALAGAITSLFFPPAGLALLAGAAVLGGGYLVVMTGGPWVRRAINWGIEKINKLFFGAGKQSDSDATLKAQAKLTETAMPPIQRATEPLATNQSALRPLTMSTKAQPDVHRNAEPRPHTPLTKATLHAVKPETPKTLTQTTEPDADANLEDRHDLHP